MRDTLPWWISTWQASRKLYSPQNYDKAPGKTGAETKLMGLLRKCAAIIMLLFRWTDLSGSSMPISMQRYCHLQHSDLHPLPRRADFRSQQDMFTCAAKLFSYCSYLTAPGYMRYSFADVHSAPCRSKIAGSYISMALLQGKITTMSANENQTGSWLTNSVNLGLLTSFAWQAAFRIDPLHSRTTTNEQIGFQEKSPSSTDLTNGKKALQAQFATQGLKSCILHFVFLF